MNKSKSKSNSKKWTSSPWKNPQQWMDEVQAKADEVAQSQGYQDYNDAVAQGAGTSGNSGKPVSDIEKPQPTIKDPYVPGTTFGDMFGPPKLETGTPNIRPNPIIDEPVPDYKTPIDVPDTFEPPLAEDQVNPPDHPGFNPPIDSPPSDDFSPAPLDKDVKKTEKDTSPSTGESSEISWYYWGIPLAVIVIGGAIYFMSSSSPTPQPIPTVNLRASEYFTPSAADVVQYVADA